MDNSQFNSRLGGPEYDVQRLEQLIWMDEDFLAALAEVCAHNLAPLRQRQPPWLFALRRFIKRKSPYLRLFQAIGSDGRDKGEDPIRKKDQGVSGPGVYLEAFPKR
jgi:hypothetical protein